MATIFQKTGSNIRKIRKQLGYTQEKLAALVKMDPKSIIEIEGGKKKPYSKNNKKDCNSTQG